MSDDDELTRLRAEVLELRAAAAGRKRTVEDDISDEISAALAEEVWRQWPADIPRDGVEFSTGNDYFVDGYSWHVRVNAFTVQATGVHVDDFHAGFAYAHLRLWRTMAGEGQIRASIRSTAEKTVKHVLKYAPATESANS